MKNSLSLKLRMETIFVGAEEQVAKLKKTIGTLGKSLKSTSIGKDLASDMTGVEQTFKTVNTMMLQLKNFNFKTGSLEEYNAILNQTLNFCDQIDGKLKDIGDKEISFNMEKTSGREKGQVKKVTVSRSDLANLAEEYELNLKNNKILKTTQGRIQAVSTIKKKQAKLTKVELDQQNKAYHAQELLTAAAKDQHLSITELCNRLVAYKVAIEATGKANKDCKKEIEKNSKAAEQFAINLGTGWSSFDKAIEALANFNDAANQSEKELESFKTEIDKSASIGNLLSESLDNQLIRLASFSTLVAGAEKAISGIINKYKELDTNLSAIASVSGQSTDSLWNKMPEYSKKASDLGISIENLTEGMLLFYQQGLDSAETMTRLDAAGKLAKISGDSLSTSVNTLTAAMNSFQLTGKDANRVIDSYAQLAKVSAVDVGELSEAMSIVGPLARQAGLSIETTSAFLAQMISTTRQSASTVGNALKTIVARFRNVNEEGEELSDGTFNKVAEAFKSIDISLTNANGGFRDFDEVISELAGRWDSLTSAQQAYIATQAAGTRQQAQFIALVSDYQSLMGLVDESTNSAGAAQEQFSIISDNLTTALTRLNNEVVNFQTQWTNGANALTGIVDVGTQLLKFFTSLPQGLQLSTIALTSLLVKEIAHQAIIKRKIAAQKHQLQVTIKVARAQLDLAKSTYANLKALKASTRLTEEQTAAFKALGKEIPIAESRLNQAENAVNNLGVKTSDTTGFFGAFIDKLSDTGKAGKATAGVLAALGGPTGMGILLIVLPVAIELIGKFIDHVHTSSKELEEFGQKAKEASSEAFGKAASAQEYINQIQEAVDANQSLADIRKDIQETFGETIGKDKNIDVEIASIKELNQALAEEIELQTQIGNIKSGEVSLANRAASNKKKTQIPRRLQSSHVNSSYAAAAQVQESSEGGVVNPSFEFNRFTYNGTEYSFDTVQEGKEKYGELIARDYNTLTEGVLEDQLIALNSKKNKGNAVNTDNLKLMQTVLGIDTGTFDGKTGELLGWSKEAEELIGDSVGQTRKNIAEKLNSFLGPESEQYSNAIIEAVLGNPDQLHSAMEEDKEGFNNFLNGLFNNSNQQAQEIGGFLQQQADNYSTNLQIFESALEDSFSTSKVQDLFKSFVNEFGYGFVEAFNRIDNSELQEKIANFYQGLIEGNQELEKIDLSGLQEDLKTALGSLDLSTASGVTESINFFKENAKALGLNNEALESYIKYLYQLQGTLGNSIQSLDSLNESMTAQWDALKKLRDDGTVSFEELSKSISQAGLELSEDMYYFDETSRKFRLTDEAAIQAAESVQKLAEEEARLAIQSQFTNLLKNDSINQLINENGLIRQLASGEAELSEENIKATKAALEEAKSKLIAGQAESEHEAALAEETAELHENTAAQLANSGGSQYMIEHHKLLASQARERAKDLRDNTAKLALIDQQLNSLKQYDHYFGHSTSIPSYFNDEKKAASAAKDALEAHRKELENSKKALENQKKSLEDSVKSLKNVSKAYQDIIKTKINATIDDLTKKTEAGYKAAEELLKKEIEGYKAQLEQLEDAFKKLDKEASKFEELAKHNEEELQAQADAAKKFYDQQKNILQSQIDYNNTLIEQNQVKIDSINLEKDAIQQEIDALTAQADATSTLLELEKAKDAYAEAKSQKNKLSLTSGGWRMKTDKDAVEKAAESLQKAETNYQREVLTRQLEDLDTQIEEINKTNSLIEKQNESIEKTIDKLDKMSNSWDKAAEGIGKTTEQLRKEEALLKQFANATDLQLQSLLAKFGLQVQQGQDLSGQAADKREEADKAKEQLDYQKDADNPNSLAGKQNSVQEAIDKLNDDLKEHFNGNLAENQAEQQRLDEAKAKLESLIAGYQEGQYTYNDLMAGLNEYQAQLNQTASGNAETVNQLKNALEDYSKFAQQMDMTTAEWQAYLSRLQEVNNSSLESLLPGGDIYKKMADQVIEAQTSNDQIKILDGQIQTVQDQIDSLSNQEQSSGTATRKAISSAGKSVNRSLVGSSSGNLYDEIESEGETLKGNLDDIRNKLFAIGIEMVRNFDESKGYQRTQILELSNLCTLIDSKDFSPVINNNISISSSRKDRSAEVGSVLDMEPTKGFSTGGVDDFTETVAVHGTKSRPELVLNNSQSAALFRYIDSMTRIPTLPTVGTTRNSLEGLKPQNQSGDSNDATFENCNFTLSTNSNNFEALAEELKQRAPFRRS